MRPHTNGLCNERETSYNELREKQTHLSAFIPIQYSLAYENKYK